MSGFGGGQFDDSDVERQLQEEFRRHQAIQGVGPAAAFSALARARSQQQQAPQPPPPPHADYGARLSMLGPAEGSPGPPYYARATAVGGGGGPAGHGPPPPPHHASPYGRVGNPYAASMADARVAAAYQARASPGPDPGGSLAQLYAAQAQQRRQHQQAVQQAVASNYAVAAAAAAAYATPNGSDHRYAGAAAAAAYGLPPSNPSPPSVGYGRESTYGSIPPPGPHQDMSLLQQQQQQQMHIMSGYPGSAGGRDRSMHPPHPGSGSNNGAGGPYTPTSPAIRSNNGNGNSSHHESKPPPPLTTPGTPTNSMRKTPNTSKSSHGKISLMTGGSTGSTVSSLKNMGLSSSLPSTPMDTSSPHSMPPPPSSSSGGGGGGGGNMSPTSAATVSSNALLVAKAKDPSQPERTMSKDGFEILVDGKPTYYTGCVPLGLEDDKYWLSELQVFLRSNFAEAFAATEDDIAAPMHGRNKPIALGQVGIRCMHCKSDNPAERGQQATSYPSLISGIYNSVQQMLRLHMECCLSMPVQVQKKIDQLKLSCSSRGGRKQYWIDSAKRLGLADTPNGIHFGRDPRGPLPPLSGPSVNSKEGRKKKSMPTNGNNNNSNHSNNMTSPFGAVTAALPPVYSMNDATADNAAAVAAAAALFAEEGGEGSAAAAVADIQPSSETSIPVLPPVDPRPLVMPEDKPLISDYLYLTLEQMGACILMESDRVGCYKARKVGFPGLACKHCVGQAGCGRYFPASEASLSQTTTSQTIMNHVRNCRRCPLEIRENLEIMKRNRMGPDGKRADKPKHGGRKVFFHRLWCRIQGIPFEEGKGEPKEAKKKKAKKMGLKNRKKSNDDNDEEEEEEDHDDEDDDNDSEEDDDDDETEKDSGSSDGEETESEEETDVSEGGEGEKKTPTLKRRPSITSVIATKKKTVQSFFDGCVRLTKTDDAHWLSEMECFARKDLVEVFSLRKKDNLDGYGGRKEPSMGQVGIRCVFCKTLDPADRPNGSISFPDSIATIHVKVADMIRLHFPNCPSMSDDAKETFKSLRGFDAKVASDDSLQYWVDTARDIGLSNAPPIGTRESGGWGITFRRDPIQPSPADELDLEANKETKGNSEATDRNVLVRLDDRGLCTDQVMLLLRQVRPCRFKNSDRRAGPGSRGRDRAMGFPGLSCMHCAGRNTLGRYFPVSAKNLTDSTANSLQAHVSSCAHCPEPIKASLAYLGHRSILQKAELSGSWKKTFFKKIWDRLHIERGWTSIDDEELRDSIEYQEIVEAAATAADEIGAGEEAEVDEEEEVDSKDNATEKADGDREGEENEHDSDGREEDLGENMNALIKAAAIWLTEQDAATDTVKSAARANRLPAANKRPSGPQTSKNGKGNLPTKRRRVHF